MQIRNVAQFRTDWKVNQGYDMPNWDEHFMGSIHGEVSGFYKMVNGIVTNLKADMTPKLQNSQDEQAIYEFLQNAADSLSEDCAVIYDEEFFMVLNNGKPFSDDDIKAVLNSFQGTKADKTKAENCGKIGRYGIGFKLVHRLVGKSDGAEELLNKQAGPLLFSWQHSKQFDELLKVKSVADLKQGNGKADDPWLLKIALACFPASPEEKVKGKDFEDAVPFKAEELNELVDFLHRHEERLKGINLEKGSLIFLRFGPKKHEKLQNSLLNLRSGIGYSMNTLKTLHRVILQEEIVEQEEIEQEVFSITPNTDAFKKIDPEFPFCPIEMVFGFQEDTDKAMQLKSAPNLYQFFPMRNEQHRLAFFVHATSFAKITDRTRLDDQGEANFATFQFLADSLKQRLNQYKKENFDRFASIYKVILLSDPSDLYNRDLINGYLYEPLLKYIQANIPTVRGNCAPKNIVLVKGTQLPVEPVTFGIGKEWFYWNEPKAQSHEQAEALKAEKLGLNTWNIRDLIMEGDLELINDWIQQLDAEDYAILIEELKTIEFDRPFLKKFFELKCLRFADQSGETNFYTLDELQNNENAFLLTQKTFEIKEELRLMGYAVFEFNLSEYKEILNSMRQQLPYLFDNKLLFAKVTSRIAEYHAQLSGAQKLNIFNTLKSLRNIGEIELKNLALFTDRKGNLRPLKALVSPKEEVEEWIQNFFLEEQEETENLLPYLASKDKIFTELFFPYWDDVKNVVAEEAVAERLEQVQQYYKLGKFSKPFEAQAYVYTDAQFAESAKVFYHPAMMEVDDYTMLTTALKKLVDLEIPNQAMLPFLEKPPFKTKPINTSTAFNKVYDDIVAKSGEVELLPKEQTIVFELLQKLTDPKKLERLSFFKDQKGRAKPLKNLIPAEMEVPEWLAAFKIEKREGTDALANLMVSKENIFLNVITPYWEEIIEEKSIQNDVASFYESLKSLFDLNRFNKPFAKQAFCFVNKYKGFATASEVLYHPALNEVENYGALKTAIEGMVGKSLPEKSILPFLEDAPFKLANATFRSERLQETAEVNTAAVQAFMQFCHLKKEAFFQHFYVEATEKRGTYRVGAAKKSINQVYIGKGKEKIAQVANEKLSDKFKLLPEKFFHPEYDNNGLANEAILYKEVMNVADAELLPGLVMESGNQEIQSKFISHVPDVMIKEGVTYEPSSEMAQPLQVFNDKSANHAEFRKKLKVEDAEGNVYQLSEIAWLPEVTFQIEGLGKYEIPLAEILPRFAKINQLKENLVAQFVDFKESSLRKRVFSNGEEMPIKQVLEELGQNEGMLENGAQLAYILLAAKTAKDPKKVVQSYQLKTLAETIQIPQEGDFFLENLTFVEPNALLDGVYNSAAQWLKLNEKRPVFESGKVRLATTPYFVRNVMHCPIPAQSEENAEAIFEQLLEFVYQKWMEFRPEHIEIAGYEGTGTEDVFGFEPAEMVFPDIYALEEETMPTWLHQWIDDTVYAEKVEQYLPAELSYFQSRQLFLKAIGVHTESSELVQVRRYLQRAEGEVTQKMLNALEASPSQTILRTLQWLMGQKIVFSNSDERLQWLRRLYYSLATYTEQTPVPVVQEVEGGELNYHLVLLEGGTLYLTDENRQQQLMERYGIYLDEVVERLAEDGDFVTDQDIRILEMPTSKIEEELDLERLQEESREWGANYYAEWKDTTDYRIFLFDGAMPYRIHYLDRVIKEVQKDNAVLHEAIAFVNGQCDNVEKELFAVSRTNGLNSQILLNLLKLKNEQTEQVGGHIRLEESVPQVVDPKTQQEAAARKLYQYLEAQDLYDVTAWDTAKENAHVMSVLFEEEPTYLILKQGDHGKWQLDNNEWDMLQNGAKLFVVEGEAVTEKSLSELRSASQLKLTLDPSQLNDEDWEKLQAFLKQSRFVEGE